VRTVTATWRSRPTLEGAGVRLRRAFGFDEAPSLDPFLLLDDFGSDDPRDYVAGFPWHPHRGIETVTYLLRGTVGHGDSLGNGGSIGPGDVQWMTAGSGIIHQEMPQAPPDRVLRGFQLWVNLPRARKMSDPRYRGHAAAELPVAELGRGVTARVVAGEAGGVRGPVRDLFVDVRYLDVTAVPGARLEHPVPGGHRCLLYVAEGEGRFGAGGRPATAGSVVVLEGGGAAVAQAGAGGCRFLLVSGEPIGEPVAWYGPIVMNTEEELEEAFREYREGTFIRVGRHRAG